MIVSENAGRRRRGAKDCKTYNIRYSRPPYIVVQERVVPIDSATTVRFVPKQFVVLVKNNGRPRRVVADAIIREDLEKS